MYRYAQILQGKAHCIFDHKEPLEILKSDYFSAEIVLVDITNVYPQPLEGYTFDGSTFTPPLKPTLDVIKAVKLEAIDQDAARAYEAGFYSTASGVLLYYDSDLETQKLLNGMYARTVESDWLIKVRYPGAAPAGKAPIRARPTAESPLTDKTVQLLDAAGLKIIIDDLDSYLYGVKLTLWQLQAALQASATIEEVQAVTWPA